MIAIWTNQLSVGNRLIDSAHEDILGKLNRIGHLVGTGDRAALPEALKLLEECLHACFEVEERIAQAINFDFSRHKLAHQHLLNDFQRKAKILTTQGDAWDEEEGNAFVTHLVKSVIQHIKMEGMVMKPVLDTHYYDFNPG